MTWSDKIRRITAGLFAVLFVTYYANVSLFIHAHIINGTTIVHSHIYGNGHLATTSGGHTSTEVTLIAHLNDFVCSESIPCDADLTPNLNVKSVHDYRPIRQVVNNTGDILSLRAPPVL